ncbi:aspartate/glutamate racemase family protein [Alcaligenes endophyticus]|uniref:Aspartate/glutamate racemase family protein n=1 Tax=Alcaligenes endophyticus TaxID=1929088 RepID=A0ABT8EN36_9BURK|nr:aspartate/glutamate racemase family protein [Alcaligenes endophyticus]MCX5591403.1 aspartate/glutamate racemase family protein [Alcaligenes endophyticus]MDN4122716.1 aspartate/glutamate racemase family protein [Alcaligenes endophyticus]
MRDTLYIINPNSNQAVTAGLDKALNIFRGPGVPRIECVTMVDGPAGIQSQLDVDKAAVLVQEFAHEHQQNALGFISACFSDPGLHGLREMQGVLSMGISECAVLTALSMGQKFGVIAILPNSIPRHWRMWSAMGVHERVAGEVAIGRTVAQLSDEHATLEAMQLAGKQLRDQYGAQVLIMGCAGMASFREPLSQALSMPVVEPVQAAVSMALGRLQLGWA